MSMMIILTFNSLDYNYHILFSSINYYCKMEHLHNKIHDLEMIRNKQTNKQYFT